MTREIEIPESHPRAVSLRLREQLIKAWKDGIVAEAGLLAHGRGEAFDYLIGEKTIPQAERAVTAAAAMLLESKLPLISVNGNSAALSAHELVELADNIGGKLEVNLFYRSEERALRIAELLRRNGAGQVLGVDGNASSAVPGLESERKRVDPRGIMEADTILVPLEDGDRSQALRNMGKRVIAIDLNPLSRTARAASITIVDNIVRAVPLLISESKKLSKLSSSELRTIATNFDNQGNLQEVIRFVGRRLTDLSQNGLFVEAD